MYSFDAHYDEAGAGRAERLFVVRGLKELRLRSTFLPPVFFAFMAALMYVLHAEVGMNLFFTYAWLAIFALSIAMPVFFYLARPMAARWLARKYPVRRITLSPDVISIEAKGMKRTVRLARVKHIWEADSYLLLVLSEYIAVSIPMAGMPEETKQFILSSARNVA